MSGGDHERGGHPLRASHENNSLPFFEPIKSCYCVHLQNLWTHINNWHMPSSFKIKCFMMWIQGCIWQARVQGPVFWGFFCLVFSISNQSEGQRPRVNSSAQVLCPRPEIDQRLQLYSAQVDRNKHTHTPHSTRTKLWVNHTHTRLFNRTFGFCL